MAKRLEATGDEYICDLPVAYVANANDIEDTLVGLVVEVPGEADDRFYFIRRANDEQVDGKAVARFLVSKMREVPAPDWWMDWRKVYRSMKPESPLATRLMPPSAPA